MHLKTRTWFLVSLLCFILAGYFWHLGNERYRRDFPATATNHEPAVTPIKELGANNFHHAPPPLLTTPSQSPILNSALPTLQSNVARTNPLLTNRLSNTSKSMNELMYSDSAVLLRNALIDTSVTGGLNIPEHMRAEGDPGSYIIQSRARLDNDFRARLSAAGATIVSYIPNNAYLVRVSEAGANQMRSLPQTQSVLPWEPYYKLDLPLLALAVQNEPLAPETKLNVLVFPGEREAGLEALKSLGAKFLGEDRSPFGHELIVQPPSDVLPVLARLPLVQSIQIHHPRQLVNDLNRPRLGVATNSTTAPNYLGLTGQGVSVSVNDTGIDAGHPDFDTRVSGDTMAATIDYDGHGTHVAGTIAGSGVQSSTVMNVPPGSTNGFNFRGIAPMARLFISQIDLITGPVISDTYLQEVAAANTNLICNNSWGYVDSQDYDFSAASFDAAVRDALPGQPGPDPVLFVFAAGNSGGGATDGQGGSSETVGSPATAKNVISVGAIEQARGITNLVIDVNGKTNLGFFAQTDSDNQVTSFSSRGNVGIGLEGPAGRFKPDVVAPGSFVISTRAANWTDPKPSGGVIVNRFRGEIVKAGKTNPYAILIPQNASRFDIITRSNVLSPNPFPGLPIYAKAGVPTTTNDFVGTGTATIQPVAPGQWYYTIGNNSGQSVNYDLITVIYLQNTNSGNYFEVLSNLNSELAPWYRYESGTSQAAPAVSGTLALMQEFFQTKLMLTNDQNIPALMKAMLINGARSMPGYFHQVQNAINYQGWGVVNLTNSIPPAMNGGLGSEGTWPIAFFHTNTLYTGQSHTRTVALNNFARAYPLRFTLVWTDPPGNPAASLKLVNDLDLIVSNNIPNGEVYIGNNIPQASDFNSVTPGPATNLPPTDVVNNVENVFINRPIPGTNYTVTVRAHRVNVNAVTTQTNGVLQDYALVISCGNTLFTNALTVSDISVVPQIPDDTTPFVKFLTNGVPLLHERVGANNPLIDVLNNGVINQWNFYVFTITPEFTNANLVFATFLSANLSLPRFQDADIDLYVSHDGALTNLDPNVINDAINSVNGGRVARSRGGTETIVYTNVAQNDVFYLAVKSEDQQAGEFGILAMGFDDLGRDGNGNIRLVFTGTPVAIPDGSPGLPMGTNVFAFVFDPADVRRVVLTNDFVHENGGDLYGVLHHLSGREASVVLNNHRSFIGTQEYLYDDAPRNQIPGSQIPDGPGSLRDFVGEPATGLWAFTISDNSPYDTGTLERLIGYIEPADKTNLLGVELTAGPMQWSECLQVDVPLNATNLNIYLVQQPPNPLSVDLYVLLGDCPDFVNYDKKQTIDPPGGVLSLSVVDSPGLQPGNRYYYAFYNANSVDVSARLRVEFGYGLRPIASQTYYSPDTPKVLPDDAVTNSFITVTNNRTVADVKVGLRLDHPRLSDTVVHLVSPQGTRILLTESHGGWTNTSYGFGIPVTYVYPFAANGTDLEFRTNIDTAQKSGVITITYDFFNVPDDLRVYYDGDRIYDSGYISGAGTVSINYGPGLSSVVTVVMNEGNGQSGTVWEETVTVTGPWNYTTFTDNPNLAGPIKFGVPPYYIIPTNRTALSNSFEGVDTLGTNQTNFAQGQMFAGGWMVMTNGVAVFSDTNHLYASDLLASTNWGTNFLALSDGQVCLPLGTNIIVPDKNYVLNFIHRKVSSSPTQSVDLLILPTADIFQQLSVSNNFPAAADPPQWATKVRLCPGQEVIVAVAPGQGAEGLTNELYAGLPLYGLIGCFGFNQDILTSNTVAGAPFYIGTNAAVITAPTDPGDYYLFLGINNNDFNVVPTNNLNGFYTATAYFQHCQDAMSEVRLGANAIPIVGSTQWKVETVRFLANPTMTNLCLAPKLNTTMLFDSFQIDEEVTTSYYQSDEPMTPFKGELALGDWRLEVLDNRSGTILSGGTNDSGTLFSWSLNLIFADGPTAIPLTNGVFHTNVVRGSQIKYFIVAVPKEVTSASNIVFNLGPGLAGLQLLYSPFGLPTGNSPPDPLTPVPDGFPIIANLVTPPGAELPVGRFYYLGVRNVDPTEVNNFVIQAEFNIPVYPLPNGIIQKNEQVAANSYSFADIRLHPELAVTNMHYYYFDINSTNIVSMTFSVFPFQISQAPVNGDVNIVLRRALPVVDLFPRPTFFDYESTQPNFGNELILVNSNSLPVKLTPGRWYLGVYNTTNATANYDIVAQWSVAPLWSYVDLANGVPQPFLINSFDPLTNFYRFVVDQTNANAAAVLFEIYTNLDTSGDPDLLVKRADVPSPDLYEFSYLQVRDSFSPFEWLSEKIALRTNVFLPGLSGTNMLVPNLDTTNWFLQIVNANPLGGTISGWVCAKVVDPISGLLYDCQDMNVVVSNNFNPGTPFSFAFNSVPGEYYAVEETLNFKTWTTAKTVQATKPKTSFNASPAQPGAARFYRIRHVRPPSSH